MNLVQIDDIPRRELFKRLAVAIVAMEAMPLVDAQEVHNHANQEKSRVGTYKPKLFNEHEYKTVARLAELIVRADDVSGSAIDAGASEFIDLLASHNQKLADILHGWNRLDGYVRPQTLHDHFPRGRSTGPDRHARRTRSCARPKRSLRH